MRRKNKKKRKIILMIENIFLVLLAVFTITIFCYALIKPDSFYEKLDGVIYKVLKVHIYADIDRKVNSNNIIKKAVNKDYTNSIFNIYYELLDDDEKDVYDDIYDAITKYDENITIPSIEINDISNILHSVLYDHPEIFWVDIEYGILKSNNGTKLVFKYKYDIDTINKNIELINKEIDKIISEANKLNTDYEKEIYVHDTLSKEVTYNKRLVDDQSIYNLFINKEAVCTGYAKAFQLIMTKLGIPTYTITGYTTENHAWNIIELEDGFYNVDVTYDDLGDITLYKYFNQSDENISKDHIKDTISSKFKYENGTKYINTYSTIYKKTSK